MVRWGVRCLGGLMLRHPFPLRYQPYDGEGRWRKEREREKEREGERDEAS